MDGDSEGLIHVHLHDGYAIAVSIPNAVITLKIVAKDAPVDALNDAARTADLYNRGRKLAVRR